MTDMFDPQKDIAHALCYRTKTPIIIDGQL